MKTVLIVANGKRNSKKFTKELTKKADFIIGVDGGAGTLIQYGIDMNIAIGDFDSIDPGLFKKLRGKSIQIEKFPEDKDLSDTELAVRFAMKNNFDNFILNGMLGKRTDHTLFNLSVLIYLLKKKKKASITEENEEIFITDNIINLNTNIGDIISIYPVTMKALILQAAGLKYSLKNRIIKKNSTLTLSNIAISNKISVEVKNGTVLILKEIIF